MRILQSKKTRKNQCFKNQSRRDTQVLAKQVEFQFEANTKPVVTDSTVTREATAEVDF